MTPVAQLQDEPVQMDTPQDQAARAPLAPKGNFYLQLGAYAQAQNAEASRQKLQHDALPGLEVVRQGALYKVLGGPFSSRADALRAAGRMGEAEGKAPLVVERWDKREE
jgi:rare lipoprotein A